MKIQFYEILLRISDEKINLEGKTIFKNEIMGEMQRIIRSNSRKASLKQPKKKG
jgi:hypothetical protein